MTRRRQRGEEARSDAKGGSVLLHKIWSGGSDKRDNLARTLRGGLRNNGWRLELELGDDVDATAMMCLG